jgi:hypothetical protein
VWAAKVKPRCARTALGAARLVIIKPAAKGTENRIMRETSWKCGLLHSFRYDGLGEPESKVVSPSR